MTRHAYRLFATVALLGAGLSPARAGTLVWTGGGTNWNAAASWNPAGVPVNGDDVVFGASGSGDSFANLSSLSLRSLRFDAAEVPQYNIHATGTLFFTGAGILNDSMFISGGALRQQFFANNGGAIVFQNSATIGGTTLPVDLIALSGGAIRFEGNSSASNIAYALFTGLRVEGGGELHFQDDAVTGSIVSISNRGGAVAGAPGGQVVFADRAIDDGGYVFNLTADGQGPRAIFQGNARAQGQAGFRNFGALNTTAGSEAVTQFFDDTRFAAFGENYPATVAGGTGGRLELHDRSDATGAIVINLGSATTGAAGGRLQFFDTTTAGDASIQNRTEGEPSATGLHGGVTEFFGTAKAGTATIVNNGEGTAGGTGGQTFFRDGSNAQAARITNYGGYGANAPGGLTDFSGNASAGSAMLEAAGGSVTGGAGMVVFRETSTGATARAILLVGDTLPGTLDISQLTTTGTTLGSIEGGGVVALGGKALTVGGSGLSMIFSGIVKDGGIGDGTGGSLTKTGPGTLTFSGANSYTGATAVNAGKLLVNGSLAGAPLSVASGATLGGSGSVAGAVTVADGGTLAPGPAVGTGAFSIASLGLSPASNLAFDLGVPTPPGTPGNDALSVTGNLTLDGVLDITDLGGVSLGVYRLINYGGTLTDNGLTIGAAPPGIPLSQLTVQTSIPGQVNLIVSIGTAVGYWDGANTAGNNVVDGGTGNWDASIRNWTNAAGAVNGIWGGKFAVFSGPAGAVTLTESVTTTGMQFAIDGYAVGATAGQLTLSGATNFRVNPNISAAISAPLSGGGSLTKNDTGTLVLSGESTYTGGTFVYGGGLEIQSAGGGGLGTGTASVIEQARLDFTHQAVAGANTLDIGPGQFGRTGGRLNFTGTASAGRATIQQIGSIDSNVFTVAQTSFFENSSAGGALVTNYGGQANNGAHGGEVVFWNNATAAKATITNRGAEIAGANPALVSFRDNSTAGDATILNQPGRVSGAVGATIQFVGTSAAGNAAFTNRAGIVNGAGNGLIRFSDTATGGAAAFVNEGAGYAFLIGAATEFRANSTAGAGVFNNRAGQTNDAHGGRTYFYDTATAGTGQLNNEGGVAPGGFGGVLRFFQQSSADRATITNQGSATAGAVEGGVTYFVGTATAGRATIENFAGAAKAGALGFQEFSTAGSAQIVNHGAAAASIEPGTTSFIDLSNAGSATITNRGSATGGFLATSRTSFRDNSSAGGATIINESATTNAGSGGATQFSGTATAASATIIARGNGLGGASSLVSFLDSAKAGSATLTAEGNRAGGSVGAIRFLDFADGENARVILQAGAPYHGHLSIFSLKSAGMRLGSIEGKGIVELGSKWLVVGGNNLDAEFSGEILGVGAIALVKNGTGTLTLSGANTYTGLTTINTGTLTVNGAIKGNVFVYGGTLKGTGTIRGIVTVFPGGIFAPGASPGTITVDGLVLDNASILNFELGTTSDLVVVNGDLTLDGVLNLANAGGLTVSGPFDLFRWTGTLTNNGLTIGTVPAGFTAADFSLEFSNGVARVVVAHGSGPPPPVINAQPASASAYHGATASFTAAAGAAPGLSHRWQRRPVSGTTWTDVLDGGAFTGAATATLSVRSAVAMNGDQFRVVINNDNGGSVASAAVTLTVTYAPRLLNLSTRGLAQTGDNVLIPGFVISGTANKQLLIRAVGPSLGKPPFDLAGTLANPRMTLKRLQGGAYVDVAANDDWQTNTNATDIATTAAQLFAFAFNDDREAALLLDLAPGQYTVVADDATGATGLAIVELYDADAASTDSRLINISNRGFAGVGDEVMIPGFVISPEGPKTVLVRVVGPTLGSYNVPGTMADPKLTIYSGSTPILANDNWSDNPDAAYTAQIAAQVFAFPLSSGSKDAAFVVTLPPGVYTVVGSSAIAGGTGVVLVEVYVVP